MRRDRTRWIVTALALGLALTLPTAAGLRSKSFEFKPNTTLELGTTTDDGVRLDTIRIELPLTADGQVARTAGLVRAEVAVSNVAEAARKVGLAVALHDGEGRLLGVASGGTRFGAIKPGHQKRFTLNFDHVNLSAQRATTFQISVESRD